MIYIKPHIRVSTPQDRSPSPPTAYGPPQLRKFPERLNESIDAGDAQARYLDGRGVTRVARALQAGITMVVTDLAASPETRTAPDFPVIAKDSQMPEKRRKGRYL